MKIVAVIPARLESVRLPKKILWDFHGLPMIEHVRRRALLSESLSDIIVATGDQEIADIVNSYGGKVIKTVGEHFSGSSRVAEIIPSIDCSHVLVLQGDEPLLLPEHVDSMVNAIRNNPSGDAWNATGQIENVEELDRHSFVKCALSGDRILHCFRRTPYFSELSVQQKFVKKILGLIAYSKDLLLKLNQTSKTPIESAEYIEQMRIIESGYQINSVYVEPSLPSVNEPDEVGIVNKYLEEHPEQLEILKTILNL